MSTYLGPILVRVWADRLCVQGLVIVEGWTYVRFLWSILETRGNRMDGNGFRHDVGGVNLINGNGLIVLSDGAICIPC